MAQRDGKSAAGTIRPTAPIFLSTLEVRWILPGRRPDGTTEWFNRFPSNLEERDDLYLVHVQQAGMSVKVRGYSLLELKSQQNSRRLLDVPGFATAGVKACEKWSVLLAGGGVLPTGDSWKKVRKVRRLSRFSATGDPADPDGIDTDRAACEVEMTDIQIDGQSWWTLALEATGSNGQAWDAMRATARAIFADPVPVEVHPGPTDALAYSEWLQSHCFALA